MNHVLFEKEVYGHVGFMFEGKMVTRFTHWSGVFKVKNQYHPFVICGFHGCPFATETAIIWYTNGHQMPVAEINLGQHWRQHPEHFQEHLQISGIPIYVAPAWDWSVKIHLYRADGNKILLDQIRHLQWGEVAFKYESDKHIQWMITGKVLEQINRENQNPPMIRCSKRATDCTNCPVEFPSFVAYSFDQSLRHYTSSQANFGILKLGEHWRAKMDHRPLNTLDAGECWKAQPIENVLWQNFNYHALSGAVYSYKSGHSQPDYSIIHPQDRISFHDRLLLMASDYLTTKHSSDEEVDALYNDIVQLEIKLENVNMKVESKAYKFNGRTNIRCGHLGCNEMFYLHFIYTWDPASQKNKIRLQAYEFVWKSTEKPDFSDTITVIEPKGAFGLEELARHWFNNPKHMPHPSKNGFWSFVEYNHKNPPCGINYSQPNNLKHGTGSSQHARPVPTKFVPQGR